MPIIHPSALTSSNITIEDHLTSTAIMIPVKRNRPMLLFMGIFCITWLLSELVVLAILTRVLGNHATGWFEWLWLLGWTLGGGMIVHAFIWQALGKEIITVDYGELTIDRKGYLFFKPQQYHLPELQNLRVADTNDTIHIPRNSWKAFYPIGKIMFDYRGKTIRFGNIPNDAAALEIVQLLQAKYVKQRPVRRS